MVTKECTGGLSGKNQKERAYWEDLEVDGRILYWMLEKQDGAL
jgi:hypothetical protein